jgi:acetylglutamate kinase
MAATTKKNGKTVVVALGGNAILQPGQVGTFEEQLFNIDTAMRRIAELVEDGWRVVLTHGNGPQVGNLLIQNASPRRRWRRCRWTSAAPRARARSATWRRRPCQPPRQARCTCRW